MMANDSAPKTTPASFTRHNAIRFDKNCVSMKTYQCIVCGFIYDEAQGLPPEGIAPGTKWEDVPDTWVCPDCGVGKADFEMVEI